MRTQGSFKTTTQFIKNAQKVHGNKFDYSLVEYKGAKHKVQIKCPKGHIFEQTPNDHLNNHGCKICKGWGLLKDNGFELKATQIHNGRYDYSKSIYVDYDNVKLIIICPIHGEFNQTPHNHLHGAGCPKCSYIVSSKKRVWTKEKFIEKANKIHNNFYDYSKVEYTRAPDYIEVICPNHGSFWVQPKCHIHQSHGCPKCRRSKGEILIEELLKSNKINYISQHKFDNCVNPKTGRKLRFDFYLPDKNLLIEYDGELHFRAHEYYGGEEKLKETQFRDQVKNKFCKKNNIRLIRIKYTKLYKTLDILKKNNIII